MDERELANQVLGLTYRTAYEHAAHRIVSIHLAIGGRRIIDPQQLASTFDLVARGTVAEGAALQVKILPVRHHCQNCGIDFDGSTSNVPCPNCSRPHTEFIGGEEKESLKSKWTTMRPKYDILNGLNMFNACEEDS